VLDPFWGGHQRSENECYGIPVFNAAAGVVRWSYPSLEIAGEHYPAFVQQILHRHNPDHRSCLRPWKDQPPLIKERHPLIIDFGVHLHRETASSLLRKSVEADWAAQQEYAGKIVILGGSYHAGEELRMTPIGRLSGLQLNGYALWSALYGRGWRELATPWAIAIELCVGFALMLYNTFRRPLQFATISMIVVAFFLISLLLWQYALFLSFVPMTVGVFAHWYIERQGAKWTDSTAAAEHST
jgi:hypothetical protein